MDLNIIITWSIVILSILSIIIFFSIKNKYEDKSDFSFIQSFAKENNSTITIYDHLTKIWIGIDDTTNKLFFIKKNKNNQHKEVIPLYEVLNCHVQKTGRTTKIDTEKIHVIDKIELVFTFIDYTKPEISLEFYNNEYDQLTLIGELQLAEKWEVAINKQINANKNHNTKESGAISTNKTSPANKKALITNERNISKKKDQYAPH